MDKYKETLYTRLQNRCAFPEQGRYNTINSIHRRTGQENEMAFRDEIIGRIRQQYPYLEKKYGVKRIGLFGSVVRREEGPDSDVDIVVEFSKPVGLGFMEFAREMEQLCGRRVDVLTPEGIRNIRVQDVSTSITKDIVYV